MISTYRPEYGEMWFRQAMLADEETMAYNRAWGGVIPFPEERWAGWYGRWVAEEKGKRFYRYLKNESGDFVGEIAYHLDDETGSYLAHVLIDARHRGKGYGGQALEMLCAAARERGIAWLYDDIAADNPAVGMFLRRGFTEDRRTEDRIILKKRL